MPKQNKSPITAASLHANRARAGLRPKAPKVDPLSDIESVAADLARRAKNHRDGLEGRSGSDLDFHESEMKAFDDMGALLRRAIHLIETTK